MHGAFGRKVDRTTAVLCGAASVAVRDSFWGLNQVDACLQVQAAKAGQQPIPETSGGDAGNEGEDASEAGTVNSGETEPHESSEDEEEEIIGGTTEHAASSIPHGDRGGPEASPHKQQQQEPSKDIQGKSFWHALPCHGL